MWTGTLVFIYFWLLLPLDQYFEGTHPVCMCSLEVFELETSIFRVGGGRCLFIVLNFGHWRGTQVQDMIYVNLLQSIAAIFRGTVNINGGSD